MNERDSELHAQWRKYSAQTPPPALDDAIRAAAHRAVKSKPTSMKARAPWPTWATFAAAASIGVIAIGVWQMQPREFDETRMVTSDVPSRATQPVAIAPPTAEPGVKDQRSVAPAVKVQPPATRAQQQLADPAANSATLAPQTEVPDHDVETLGSRFRGNDGEKHDTAADAGSEKRNSATTDARDSAAPGDRQANAMQSPAPAQDKTQQQADTTRAPSPFPAAGGRQHDALTPSTPPPNAKPAIGKLAAPSISGANSPGAREPAAPPAAAAGAAPAPPPPPAMMKQRVEAQRSPRAAQAAAPSRSVNDFVDALRRAITEHRDADAARLLADMRAQYADADSRLPADLRTWAARVAPLTH